jgi:uncharacterized protein (DUF433 family)
MPPTEILPGKRHSVYGTFSFKGRGFRPSLTVTVIASTFPSVSAQDVQAVIAFAAASAEEDLPIPPMPKVA